MVYRIYVEKKSGLDNEAVALKGEISTFLGINSVSKVRILNRYDAENITEELFNYAVGTVFSEPQLDDVYTELVNDGAKVFATEFLPGQFDQRADSAAQCIQLISQGDKPAVASARVYMLYGNISDEELAIAKKFAISACRTVSDSTGGLIQWYSQRAPIGVSEEPMQMAERLSALTARDVAEYAQRLTLDTVYFLEGSLPTDAEEE